MNKKIIIPLIFILISACSNIKSRDSITCRAECKKCEEVVLTYSDVNKEERNRIGRLMSPFEL